MMLNIIHLEHRKDRLELLQKELAEQGIYQYQIWDGIWDRKQPCKGISKSHKQIIKFARDNKLPSIMVAEDDLKFTAIGAFQHFLQNEPSDYDLYLGGIYYGNIKKDNSVEDFAGLTLYIIHQRFYNTFLSISEETDLDRSLTQVAVKGIKKIKLSTNLAKNVPNKFICTYPYTSVKIITQS